MLRVKDGRGVLVGEWKMTFGTTAADVQALVAAALRMDASSVALRFDGKKSQKKSRKKKAELEKQTKVFAQLISFSRRVERNEGSVVTESSAKNQKYWGKHGVQFP